MTEILYGIVAGLFALLLVLVVTIVVGRAVSDARRRRERELRPKIEAAIAGYLASDADEPPALPSGKGVPQLTREIGLETLVELRGGERARLIELLERWDIVLEARKELLRSRRKRVRRSAAEALAQMESAEGVETLRVALGDRDAEVRLSSAAGLAEFAADGGAEDALAVAEEFAVERPGAAAAIVLTIGRRAPATLAEGLGWDAEPELRRLCAAVIGELRLAEHAPALRNLLASDDNELVARAARGLGKIGDGEAVRPLLALTAEAERPWFVKLAATSALGAIGDPQAAAALERELETGGWRRQQTAARALALLGDAGQAALRRAVSSPVSDARAHAKAVLAQ